MPGASDWSVKKTNQPALARSSKVADIETNPGPVLARLVWMMLLMQVGARPLRAEREPTGSTRTFSLSTRWEKRVLFINTNNLYFQGNSEFNLVKYSSQSASNANYHGKYHDKSINDICMSNAGASKEPNLEETVSLVKKELLCQ